MIKMIFWDIDGTLTNDQIHKAKHRVLAKKANYDISESEGMQLNGVSDANTYTYLCSKSDEFLTIYPNVENYLLDCRNFFELHAANPHSEYRVKARQGVISLVHELSGLGIYQACVTSAPDWQAERNMTALGVSEKMMFIQMLTDGVKPKPNPDLYLLAYEEATTLILNLKKSEILVIEDSFSGVSAAEAAGLQVIHCRMRELAPASDKTMHHAFTFEQVKRIMIEKFDMPLCPSMHDIVIQQQALTPYETKPTSSHRVLSTGGNTIWAEKNRLQKRDGCGLKLPSGNIHQWPYVSSEDFSSHSDELRPNRVYYP